MDNVAFHNCAEIRDKIVVRGHFIKYLPSYSPFLNPIENIFSQWKQLAKKRNTNNQMTCLIPWISQLRKNRQITV